MLKTINQSFILRYIRSFFNLLKNSWYLFKTDAPIHVILSLTKTTLFFAFFNKKGKDFNQISIDELKISHDWCTGNIPYWNQSFRGSHNLQSNIEMLEIGSWEGLSTHYLLNIFEHSKITCVDTWKGADEHQFLEELNSIENRFDTNLSPHSHRITKYKGSSFEFFNKIKNTKLFDLIYVDGSHHANDVVIDAFCSFSILRKNGFIIFDDYLWCYYKNIQDNPASAINAFLRINKGRYKIVNVYHQLILQKI